MDNNEGKRPILCGKMPPEEALKKLDETTIGDLEWKIALTSAVEKQIPQPPQLRKAGRKSIDYVCPYCAARIISQVGGEFVAGFMANNCHNCGQALDWSDTE